jgi:long-chain acyl-CoA synthetase
LSSATDTIHGAVFRTAAAHPKRTALMYRSGGAYVGVSYADLTGAVKLAAERIAAFGIRKGDAVGIFSPNRPQWIVADLAALTLGAIVVPVYNTLPPDRLKYIVNDSGMRMLFVGDPDLFSKVGSIRDETPGLEEVIFLDDWGIRFGSSGTRNATDSASARRGAADDVAASDVATIVYTSGTRGVPKGVELTHGNIVSNVNALIARGRISSDDTTVSYLPLAHMFERTCGHYVFLFAGGTVAYADRRETVVEDVGAVRPTVLIAVPRVLEKAYEMVRARVEGGPWVRRGMVHRAFSLLNARANRLYRGQRVPVWLSVRCRMYDALVASRFRNIAGGRLRLVVSGGAPLDRRTGKVLSVLGFGIVEGYGLTEASPVVSCGDLENHRLGTVGRPLDGVEVMIADNSEIMVRGPNVMKGYLNKPEETAEVLDSDGWLHTGDLGRIDDVGNLVVTGRDKEIIVTSYGKNVCPTSVEERIARSPYIEQVVVFGDNRKAIVALVVPDREEIERHALKQGITWTSYETLIEHYAVMELLNAEIERANADAASFERVVAFSLLPDPFTQENRMLTPTLKTRRQTIGEIHAALIEKLYEELEAKVAH